jgi:predicted O-methyltransferase YrrM
MLNKILEKSIQDNIPIVRDNTLDFINKIIKMNNITSILEIGSGYGYSSYSFSLNDKINTILTIEKNVKNYEIANEFLRNSKVKIVNCDAFEIELWKQKFDLIFIDGPKSHQELLVTKYLKHLNPHGIMIIDNIFLRKFNNQKYLTKNQKNLVKKVNEFKI